MEQKSLMQSLHTLKLPPRDKKHSRTALDAMSLTSPRADRVKRSMSPRLADLQRSAMLQRVSSPRPLQISPLSPMRRKTFICIPRSRQELISQYRHIQVFDFESVSPMRPARLSSYKLDAAELLATSLKKHYNKFFFVWRKHARDLRNDKIRRETVSGALRLVLTPSRAQMFTPELRTKSSTESKFSDKAVSFWSERLTTDPALKRSSQQSPFYPETVVSESERMAPPKFATSSIQVPPTGLSTELCSDPQDEHLAVVSDISHPEESSGTAGESNGSILRLMLALKMIVQRHKHQSFASMRLSGWGPARNNRRNRRVEESACARRLVATLRKVCLRSAWEQFRALWAMVSQLLSVGAEKLAPVFRTAAQTAFEALKATPKIIVPQRKPALSLKTALNTLLTNRLQTAFNTTRCHAALQKRRMADIFAKLRYCFQICDLARVRLLARHFNRLRHQQFLTVATPRSDQRMQGAVLSLGLKVIAQTLAQATTRGLRESLHTFSRFVTMLSRFRTQEEAIGALSVPIGAAAKRQWAELFISFQQAKRTAVIVHRGKRIISRVIRRYLRDTKSKFANSFSVWKSNLLIKQTATFLSSPEAPMFAHILSRLLTRRAALGLTALKASYFGFDLTPQASKESQAGALAIKAVLARPLRTAYSVAWEKLLGPQCCWRTESAKRTASRLIFTWIDEQRNLSLRRSFLLLSQAVRLSRALPARRCEVAERRQNRRGCELLVAVLRQRLCGYWSALREGEPSFRFERQKFSQEQLLALRLAGEKVSTNHAVLRATALELWRSTEVRRKAERAAQCASGVRGSLGVAAAMRPSILAQQRIALQHLLTIP